MEFVFILVFIVGPVIPLLIIEGMFFRKMKHTIASFIITVGLQIAAVVLVESKMGMSHGGMHAVVSGIVLLVLAATVGIVVYPNLVLIINRPGQWKSKVFWLCAVYTVVLSVTYASIRY